MLRFFRQIRYKLMEQNNTGRYFKYAMGEIVLVVIGILIALQINNWNENQKKLKVEQELLVSLKADFLETKVRLQETIKKQEEVVEFSRRLIELYESHKLIENSELIPDYVCFGALSWWRAEPLTGTFDAMLSTGSIELIRNKELRRYLTQFDAEIKSGFEDHEYSMDLLTLITAEQSEYLLDLRSNRARKDMGLENQKSSPEFQESLESLIIKLEANTKFFGLLTNKLVMDNNRLERQKKLQDFTINILDQIEKELL